MKHLALTLKLNFKIISTKFMKTIIIIFLIGYLAASVYSIYLLNKQKRIKNRWFIMYLFLPIAAPIIYLFTNKKYK
jgi:hypothetical protein